MTTKTDLPPLPERFDCTNGSAQWCYGCYTMTRDDLGDYVLAEDYDALRNASEALQAEIEALRAEAAEAAKVLRGALDARTDGEPLRVLANRASNALYWRTESAERAKARAERLAEALREAADDIDAGVPPEDAAAHLRARADLLREQEEGNGQ